MQTNQEQSSNTCIIIDCGSSYIKAGTQQDEIPTCIFPSLVGKYRSRYASENPDDNPTFVAEEAISQRDKLSFQYPIDHGHIDNWLDFEELLNYLFYRGLNIDPLNNDVIVTKPPLCSNRHEEKITELMFEMYQVNSLNLALQGLMALYSVGRTTGLACELGDGVTQIVPVYEGYCDSTTLKRLDFGGQEITMYLQRLLADKGYMATTRDDIEHLKIIKEQICYIARDPLVENEKDINDIKYEYKLPDGLTLHDGVTKSIELDKERFYVGEVLFDPKLIYRDIPSIHTSIMDSIMNSPMEVRKQLMGSIFISGGTSMLNGISERLEDELMFICPPQAKSNIRVLPADDRIFSVWKGAELFSALKDYQENLWISKSEYEEDGTNICLKKQPFFNLGR